MRCMLALLVIAACPTNVTAGELDGHWILSNGNRITVQGRTWTGVGYHFNNYNTYRGTWRKLGANRYFFGGVLQKTCRRTGNTMRCTPWAADWTRIR